MDTEQALVKAVLKITSWLLTGIILASNLVLIACMCYSVTCKKR